jgi:hypothetical protein
MPKQKLITTISQSVNGLEREEKKKRRRGEEKRRREEEKEEERKKRKRRKRRGETERMSTPINKMEEEEEQEEKAQTSASIADDRVKKNAPNFRRQIAIFPIKARKIVLPCTSTGIKEPDFFGGETRWGLTLVCGEEEEEGELVCVEVAVE